MTAFVPSFCSSRHGHPRHGRQRVVGMSVPAFRRCRDRFSGRRYERYPGEFSNGLFSPSARARPNIFTNYFQQLRRMSLHFDSEVGLPAEGFPPAQNWISRRSFSKAWTGQLGDPWMKLPKTEYSTDYLFVNKKILKRSLGEIIEGKPHAKGPRRKGPPVYFFIPSDSGPPAGLKPFRFF